MTGALVRAALPTARTIRWWPLGAVAVPVLGLVLLARSAGRPAEGLLLVAAAALASLVVASLRDEAATLLAPVPVSAMRRRLLRLALASAPTLLVWWGLAAAGASSEPGIGPLLALTASGVAVAVWGPARWQVLAGTAVPVVWFALDRVAAGGTVGEVLGWWRTDPWAVAVVAGAACVLGRRR